jgi:arylsulfatase A-like enzyme
VTNLEPAQRDKAPNVVLIVLDTCRADAVDPAVGDGRAPAIAQLARRGGSAGRTYATSNWTVPSHASLLTGLLPRTLGLAQVPGGDRSKVAPVIDAVIDRYLPSVLQSRGYATRGVSANPWISTGSGFAKGFDSFEEVTTPRRGRMHSSSRKDKLQWLVEGAIAKVDDGADSAADIVDRWAGEVDDRPFFWFVNLLECHSPYLPPRPHNDLPIHRRIKAASDAQKYLTFGSVMKVCLGALDVPPRALELMRHLYACSILRMDDWIARVEQRLDSLNLLDDTQIVITSDHGENLGEGGLLGHALSLDERLLRVPFISAGPLDLAPPSDGFQSIQSFPTRLASAIGFADHPWQADPLSPDIVVAQHDALGDEESPEMASVREWGLSDAALRRLTKNMTAATDGILKLVVDGDVETIYDVVADPGERSPILEGSLDGSRAALVGDLRKAVQGALVATDRVQPAAPAAPADPATPDESAELEEQMRLLGYM